MFKPFSIVVHGRQVEYERPAVMGILNATTDSFYDGGRYLQPESIVARAQEIVSEGADIIDIGATSTRPGSALPNRVDEAARLADAVSVVRKAMPDAVISVDTCFATSVRAAVEAGADMVNDISGGDFDEEMFGVVAELQVPYVMMHGASRHFNMMDEEKEDGDIIDRIVKYCSVRLEKLYRMGVKDVWLDPGFGFGKGLEGDHELLHRLDELAGLFREPILVGMSRKSMLCRPLGINPSEALAATVAVDAIAMERGARIVRVHDVKPAVQTSKLFDSFRFRDELSDNLHRPTAN